MSSVFRALLGVNFAAEEPGDKVVVKSEGMEVGPAEDVWSSEHGWVPEEELVCVCLHMLVSLHMVEPWRRGQVLRTLMGPKESVASACFCMDAARRRGQAL